MGKHSKIKENHTKKKILIIIQLILIAVMIYSGYKIVMWFIDNNKTSQMMSEVSQYVKIDDNQDGLDKFDIDFEELKKKNPDVVGWIKVNGTSIEYPVVQGEDNEYYLTHSFDKSYNQAGWAFMDYRNNIDSADKNTIIYGHNRRDGSMFESLKNVLTDEWFNNKENRTVVFITEKEKSLYEVFSVYKVEVEDYYTQTNMRDFEEFAKTLKDRSIKDFNVTINKDDQILTLSTCDDNSQYRIVLHARKLQAEEK